LLLSERQFAEGRIAELGGRSVHIVQNMILIIGTGVLAAVQFKSAFAISPVLWSAWMLYALQTDRDTRRFVAYSSWIEGQLAGPDSNGRAVPHPVRFRSALNDERGDRLLYVTPPLLAFSIHIALAGFGFVFLVQDDHTVLAGIFFFGMLCVTCVIIVVAMSGNDASTRYARAFFELDTEAAGQADGHKPTSK
jgi:hypothetical protein